MFKKSKIFIIQKLNFDQKWDFRLKKRDKIYLCRVVRLHVAVDIFAEWKISIFI